MMRRGIQVNEKMNSAQAEQPAYRAFDPAITDPDKLRDQVCQALLRRSAAERAALRNQLLLQLRQAGVNITSGLLSLGVIAETIAELTPSDLAYLIRYVRINSPQKLEAVAGLLATLLSYEGEETEHSRLAA